MGDATLGFGKHKGKTFQAILDNEKGYVAWVLKLESVTGQMKDLVDFCKRVGVDAGGAGGAPVSTQAVVAPQSQPQVPQFSAAPEPAASSVAAHQTGLGFKPGFEICAELCAGGLFRVAGVGRGFIPTPVWQAMCTLSVGTLGENKREWYFPLSSYDEFLGQFRNNPALAACNLESIPKWVLKATATAKADTEQSQEKPRRMFEEYLAALPPEVLETRPLMTFQKEGIQFGLSRGGRCLLADEMGLGKTCQALAIIANYQDEWPALVVVPSALRLVWKDQALTWLPHLLRPDDIQVIQKGKQKVEAGAKIVVLSYDLLARTPDYQVTATGAEYKVLVVDEAHYIKTAGAKRTEAVLRIARGASRCILISGTPAVSRAEDLFTQVQALLPQHVPRHKNGFCERYCVKKSMQIAGRSIIKWDGARNKDELYNLLTETIMIRRLKKDVLTQLPAKRRQRITLAAGKLNAKKMKELESTLGQRDFLDEGNSAGAVCPSIMECFKITAEAKIDAVCEYVDYLMDNDLKFLIFAHHHTMLDALEQNVAKAKVKYIRIDGKTPPQARQDKVAQFQTDADTRVAVLSITACGQGLTLTAAHTVVFAELFWNPGQMMQAEDRVHRIGQEEMVDVHYCIAEGSLDDTIFNTLNKKQRDNTAVLDGKSHHMGAYNVTSVETLTGGQSPVKKRRCVDLDSDADLDVAIQAQGQKQATPKKRGRPPKGGVEPVQYGLARLFGKPQPVAELSASVSLGSAIAPALHMRRWSALLPSRRDSAMALPASVAHAAMVSENREPEA